MERCGWARSEKEIAYHDHHWCVITHDEKQLFEMLILEGLQAGLSWSLILERWDGLKEALDDFDYHRIAFYDETKKEELLKHPAMIKNKRKIDAIITNARSFLLIQEEFGSFDHYIWNFSDYQQIKHHYTSLDEVPAYDDLSISISKDLKKRGFKFVGKTIIYSYMQAIGMVNDHLVTCPCYNQS